MSNDPNHAPPDVERLDGGGHRVERFRIQRSKAFVDEQTIQIHRSRRALDLLTKLQRQCQGGKKRLTTAQRVSAPPLAGILLVEHLKRVLVVVQRVTPAEALKPHRRPRDELTKCLLEQVRLEVLAPEIRGQSTIERNLLLQARSPRRELRGPLHATAQFVDFVFELRFPLETFLMVATFEGQFLFDVPQVLLGYGLAAERLFELGDALLQGVPFPNTPLWAACSCTWFRFRMAPGCSIQPHLLM